MRAHSLGLKSPDTVPRTERSWVLGEASRFSLRPSYAPGFERLERESLGAAC